MAGESDADKTEDPTLKKLDDAHKKGDVAKSPEVGNWLIIVAATLILAVLAPFAATQLTGWMKGVLVNAGTLSLDGGQLRGLWIETGLALATTLALPLVLLVAAGLAGSLIQHRPVWSLEPIRPKASKISPLAGFKRLFSPESLANFVKSLVKLAIVGSVIGLVLLPQTGHLDTLIGFDVQALLPFTRDIAVQMMMAVAAVLTLVAGLDFQWQRQRWFKRQKMSLQEIREEFRQSEGDPIVRAKLRQVRRERGRRRMMAAVPTASVVITNPTHYAVALKYDESMPAPICVAKGVDAVALKIRDLARSSDVPVIENPPLARSLHAQVELDAAIPPEHFRAVAEIIGYVMRMRKTPRWRAGA